MPVRTGQEVIDGLKANPPTLFINGERITDPTTHPVTKNAVASLAHLYDLQHDPELRDIMTFESPMTGDRVGRSFHVPESKEDLEKRAEMHKVWADACMGFLGRAPDYMNNNIMAAGVASDYFAKCDPRFGENMRNYFDYVRENDLAMTHALTNPQVNREVSANQLPDPYIAMGLVKETDEGIIVRGARMMATLPIADEIVIFPSTVLKEQEDMAKYALAFAIPTNTAGLYFQCREPLDYGKSKADHPLGARFDEMDAMVIFDDVLVPWDRVFLMNDVALANRAYGDTSAMLHMAHQVINLKIAKTEAILGVAQSVVDMIGSGQFQHVQSKISEIIIALEIMKGLKVACEQGATVNDYGVMTPARAPLDAARNYYPTIYPRLVEILQLLSASGLIMIPTEEDRQGPMAEHIAKYLQARNGSSDDRIKLYRLAWDMTISGFAGRQSLYEKFFFGDPVRMHMALYGNYDRSKQVEQVEAFLNQDADVEVEQERELVA